MNLRKRLGEARGSEFFRSVSVLAGGVALGHGVTALAMPVVARLYSPDHFNALAPFIGLISIIGTASCLRFDTAIQLPESDEEAANLLAVALFCCTGVSVALALAIIAMPQLLAMSLNQEFFLSFPFLLPAGVLLFGSFSAFQGWYVRTREFLSIARIRVGQSVAGAAVQLGFGWLGIAPLGLVAGQLVTSSGGGVVLAAKSLHNRSLAAVSPRVMRSLVARYRRFPTYSTLESLCNTASMQVPVIIIARVSSSPEAGYLLMAMFVMQAPMGLIGTSVNQVYASRAPGEHRDGRLAAFTLSVYNGLLRSGTGPLLFAGIVAPPLFAIIFGAEWTRAGVLVSWMTPWFVMQFLAVPVSLALHVTNRLRTAFALQASGVLVRVGGVALAAAWAPGRLAEAFAVSGFVFYSLYLIVLLRAVRADVREVSVATLRALPVLVAWIGAGVVTLGLLAGARAMWGR